MDANNELEALRQKVEQLTRALARMQSYMRCQEGGDEYPTEGCTCKECEFAREVAALSSTGTVEPSTANPCCPHCGSACFVGSRHYYLGGFSGAGTAEQGKEQS